MVIDWESIRKLVLAGQVEKLENIELELSKQGVESKELVSVREALRAAKNAVVKNNMVLENNVVLEPAVVREDRESVLEKTVGESLPVLEEVPGRIQREQGDVGYRQTGNELYAAKDQEKWYHANDGLDRREMYAGRDARDEESSDRYVSSAEKLNQYLK